MILASTWQAPEVPELTGDPVPVSLYNTATETVEAVKLEDGVARLYVCGITPYDATHLGHAATYLAFDTLVRALGQAGVPVEYSQNITDVDDPLFERADATNVDWQELASSQTDLFRGDMAALRVVPPNSYVRVQDVIEEIADAVGVLLDRGLGYTVPTEESEGEDVYFDLRASQEGDLYELGAMSHFSPEKLGEAFVEFGGDPDRPGKRSPLDPLLWRAQRDGEPSWPSRAGDGRPGWHVECAVIATGTLGDTVSIQAGGRDLRFPHHEMTAAHASAITQQRFTDHYAHAGLVAYEGAKMSKSLGNLVLVSKLTEAGNDPAAVRLAVIAHHYREDWEWFAEELVAATERLETWREAAARADAETAEASDYGQRIREAIANDLDTPTAIAIVDAWAGEERPDPAVIDVVDALLGVKLTS
ncbi:cysteine--1-D-myo-inosityl 2-amino-2-deoxy-alpha-D-glucopyranoside ligase [Gulosibacter molinativorax]|uniref:L-cysteine:1D-myo-inositol 2-amino-2-deoxy-alpha-D-glucopyranoside ligase n=1 Tax=Gulosibacter molinativorax TaxID=256821 RepID=A0ABT7C4K0_9MICO|nr:cysteine--1-D-myo-inosityl 2-amino-2-deoxy-alpha-D-glucopyranoside ligase [Gulosibacter molinativorax]MDJ1370130.1 cysteine--1-D-myo-inosityl 2-amino-2-deoxy-alpha-D-glucopyranoside ligase [Gulosibacter molinativorax]QUY61541.1 L-cysteine:1D-myo-inositol 2-amino-2-deoxy-alpha-D-glucopyranoside ligase [Gulosibacter molinativorax]